MAGYVGHVTKLNQSDKGEGFFNSMLGGSQLLSFSWTGTKKPVSVPAVSGCPPVTKKEANPRTK